jgi:hypothetical protein
MPNGLWLALLLLLLGVTCLQQSFILWQLAMVAILKRENRQMKTELAAAKDQSPTV